MVYDTNREVGEFKGDDIPYYRSFGSSIMVISYKVPVTQNAGDLHNPTELRKMMVFETK